MLPLGPSLEEYMLPLSHHCCFKSIKFVNTFLILTLDIILYFLALVLHCVLWHHLNKFPDVFRFLHDFVHAVLLRLLRIDTLF